MAVLMVSFRVGDAGNQAERRHSIVQHIREAALGAVLQEAGSLFIIESACGASTLATLIRTRSAMEPLWDGLLVIDLSEKDYQACGQISSPLTLHRLMVRR